MKNFRGYYQVGSENWLVSVRYSNSKQMRKGEV